MVIVILEADVFVNSIVHLLKEKDFKQMLEEPTIEKPLENGMNLFLLLVVVLVHVSFTVNIINRFEIYVVVVEENYKREEKVVVLVNEDYKGMLFVN